MKLKLTGLAILLLFVTLASFNTQEREKGYLYWGDRQLTWEDFKGRGPGNTPYVALTHSAIKMNFGGEEKKVWFTIETIFDHKQSWKKKNVDDHVLKHEQGHFDITEIHSRLLRKELLSAKFKKYETISSEVQKIFNANFKACDKMQDLYDDETDHSKIKEEQYRWNTKITEMLDSLGEFTMTKFELDVSYLLD
jgi:hypothetical protein